MGETLEGHFGRARDELEELGSLGAIEAFQCSPEPLEMLFFPKKIEIKT